MTLTLGLMLNNILDLHLSSYQIQHMVWKIWAHKKTFKANVDANSDDGGSANALPGLVQVS